MEVFNVEWIDWELLRDRGRLKRKEVERYKRKGITYLEVYRFVRDRDGSMDGDTFRLYSLSTLQSRVDSIYTPLCETVRERDGYKCCKCGSIDRLSIHHINLVHSDMWPSNMELLCWTCHVEKHKNNNYNKDRKELPSVCFGMPGKKKTSPFVFFLTRSQIDRFNWRIEGETIDDKLEKITDDYLYNKYTVIEKIEGIKKTLDEIVLRRD
jgi:hypothetical protein